MPTPSEDLKEINKRLNDILEGHELNSIVVANPDLNCDFEESVILANNTAYSYSHRDYFEVRWGNQPHRIKPGATRIMPAFLARHFAKHLADHILMKMEEKTGRKGLLYSPIERPKVLAKILVGVQEYFLQGPEMSQGEEVSKMVEKMNPTEGEAAEEGTNLPELNMGAVNNPVLGVLKPEPPSKEEILKNAEETEKTEETEETEGGKKEEKLDPVMFNKDGSRKTRRELIEECMRLGIEVTGRESWDTLVNKIKSF